MTKKTPKHQNPKNPQSIPLSYNLQTDFVIETAGIQDVTKLKVIVFLNFLLQSKTLLCSYPLQQYFSALLKEANLYYDSRLGLAHKNCCQCNIK